MELFKLLGTIAINNSDAKKSLDETSKEGQKTQSKLSKAFSSIGKGAAVIGKGIAVGLATGGAAMGALTVKALNLSGDLEQNMGGAEAVFGELGKTIGDMQTPMQTYDAATGKVIETTSNLEQVSKDAYKNMGLSQSDYLATANKMGALFKGAGFETQEALNLSSQAMQRAADVASIMGIDTSAAMEAVAGAAKGNFTMMDNLGVAMNDTAIGAYALEKGINKSTSEMTQQEKIGLAMEMFLDKTSYAAGNYAKENETLAGSLGTAKSALTNFLAGSGDVDSLVSSFSNLANVVVNSLKEIAPRLTTGLTELVNKVMPLIPPLLNSLLPVIVEGAVTLVNGLVQALPGILSAITSILPMLIDGVMQIADALIGALPGIISAIVGALPTLIPQLIDAAVGLFMMLVEMLPQIIQPLIDALPDIIVSIVDALLSNLPVLIQGCIQLIGALIQAFPQILAALWEAIGGIFTTIGQKILGWFEPIKNMFSNAWQSLGNVPGLSSMKTMIENVWGAVKNYISTVINAIKNVVTTIWNSIKNVISTVINSIKNVITTTWNAIKTIISNVMKLISSVLKGDWEGVKSAISNILNAIKSVISSIWNGIKNTISSVLNGIKNVVSSVWNGIKSVVSSYLNMIKTTISSVWNGIKGTISGVVNGVKTTVTKGFNDVKNKVINAFKDLPNKLKSVGKNLVQGLWNGINNAKEWVLDKIKGFGKSVLNGIKSFFGIKSPSRVMRDEVGKQLAVGVGEGISQNAEYAKLKAEELGEKILESAEKKLDEYSTYNDLTLADEIAFWDGIRQQCAEGTTARLNADKNYFSAKKSLNDQMIKAEEDLQKSINDIYQSVEERTKTIMDISGYDEAISNEDIMQNLEKDVRKMEQWQQALTKLEEKIGGTKAFEDIKNAGIGGALNKAYELAFSTPEEDLQKYVEVYNKKYALAKEIANQDMEDEVITKTQDAYQKFADTCNELGVQITDSTVAMHNEVDTAFSGMETVINTVSSALEKLKTLFESFQLNTGFNDFINNLLNNGDNLSTAATFTTNAANNPAAYEYGSNSAGTIDGTNGEEPQSLIKVITESFKNQNNVLTSYFTKLIEMLALYFPQLIEAFDVDFYFDKDVMAAELAVPMNRELGILQRKEERGR